MNDQGKSKKIIVFLVTLGILFFFPNKIFAAITTIPQVSFTNRGMILLDGKPFFPFGFYHITDSPISRYSELPSDIQKMGQAGFNVVIFPASGDNGLKDTDLARQTASDLNMYLFPYYYRPLLSTWVTGTINEANLIGWNSFDDFNYPSTAPKYTPGQITAYNTNLKNLSTNLGRHTLTYGAAVGYPYVGTNIPYHLKDYKGTMDIIGIESYPISNTDNTFSGNPLEENVAYYTYAHNDLGPDQSVWALPQTFPWTNGRYPSEKELRNMVYGGLIEGVNGIVAYTYYDDHGVFPDNDPSLWNEMVQLRSDINGDFLNAISTGQFTTYDSREGVLGPARIHAGWWIYNNKIYVVVLNTNQTLPLSASITLPSTISGNMTQLYSDSRYSNTLAFNNTTKILTGTVPAQGVEIYILDAMQNYKLGDANGDDKVDQNDYAIWLNHYGLNVNGTTNGDFNNNGKVDGIDYVVWLNNYGK